MSSSSSEKKEVATKKAGGLLDGVVNPQGLFVAAFGVAYLAVLPVTTFVAAEEGRFHYILAAFIRVLLPNALAVPEDRMIPAIAAIYTFFTFGLTGSFSAAGLAASSEKGLDNSHPRSQVDKLQGLPLRMRSAHYNLMEMYPSFAVAAALAQVLAPTNQLIVNLLGLHAMSKILVYYPVYLLDVPPPRTLSHVVATSSVINVCYLLAMGAK